MLLIYLLPLAYIAALIAVAGRGNRRAAGISLVLAAAVAAAGMWSISASRSSTAGIGMLFLPSLASVAGFCALAFMSSLDAASKLARAAGWLAAIAYVAILAALGIGGRQTIALNARGDSAYAAQQRDVQRYRSEILGGLAAAPRDSAGVDQLIRERRDDRSFVIGALETHRVSSAMLDTLSMSDDWGIVQDVLAQSSAPASAIERAYRKNPDYFALAISAHPHAPVSVLNDLARRTSNSSVLQRLASNPSLPDSTRLRVQAALSRDDHHDRSHPDEH